MTSEEFREAIENLWPGYGGHGKAAAHFGWKDTRTVRKYVSGERTIGPDLADEVRDLMARFPGGIRAVDPAGTLAMLHEQMVAQGFTAPEAAAGILGATLALVEAKIGRDAMMGLIGGQEVG